MTPAQSLSTGNAVKGWKFRRNFAIMPGRPRRLRWRVMGADPGLGQTVWAPVEAICLPVPPRARLLAAPCAAAGDGGGAFGASGPVRSLLAVRVRYLPARRAARGARRHAGPGRRHR